MSPAPNPDRHARFSQRYADGDMPWDSGITPPEIMAILDELPGGRALDLGCGTGTVMRDLLRRGWRADGVDFVQGAIDLARTKLSRFPADTWRLFCGDVTKLDDLPGLRGDYDLIIDIGCGHNLGGSEIHNYAAALASRLKMGGVFMLYASHPRPGSSVGWRPGDVINAFTPSLELDWHQQGVDSAIGFASSWYRMRKAVAASLRYS